MRFPGATHLVVGFQHQADAERFLRDFQERMAKFGLEIASGEDAADRVRAVCASTEKRGEGKTGNLHIPRVHALLWHELERPLCGLATHIGKADEGETSCHQAGVAPQDARASGGCRSVAETGGGRLLPLSRRAGKPGCARAFSRAALPLLAARSTSSQSAEEARLGTTAADL